MTHKIHLPNTGFLRLPQVLAVFPVSRSTWYAGCKAGVYPKPYKIGARCTAWRAEDIRALIAVFGGDDSNMAGAA